MVKNGWLKSKLSTHFQQILFAICIVFFVCASYFFIRYWFARTMLASRIGSQLNSIAHEREVQILAALAEQKKEIDILAHNAEFLSSFETLTSAAGQGKTSEAYKKEEAKLDQFFNQYPSTLHYKDFFLIDLQGTIFYVNKGEIIGKNLLEPQLSKSAITHSFNRVMMTLTPDVSEFSIDPLFKEPALFILQPILHNNRFMGILAVRLDETIFYKIIQNYSGLGKTGDIFVTKNIGDRVLFVAPSRLYSNVPFKKITNPDKDANTPARKASLGYTGYGLVTDSFGVKIIAAWRFVPQVDWGLAVGIQYSELSQSIQYMRLLYRIFYILALLGFFYFMYHIRNTHFIKRMRARLLSGRTIYLFLCVASIASIIINIFLIYQHTHITRKIFQEVKRHAELKVHAAVDLINQYTIQIEKITQTLARDLQTGSLQKEDVQTRISRDLKEVPDITSITIAYAPFAYDAQKRLFGIEAKHIDSQIQTNILQQDYMIPTSEEEQQTGWFDKAIKIGPFWSDPFYNAQTKKYEALYVLPFYKEGHKDPLGVIAVSYQLDKIISHVNEIEVGKTGYATVISSNGKFIYHPLAQYVKDKISILDIARGQNNQDLIDIGQKILTEKAGFGSYYDQKSKLQQWIVYEKMHPLKWTLAVFFSSESLNLPMEKLHKDRIWILIGIVITLLLLAMVISHIERGTYEAIRNFSIAMSVLFLGALLIFWAMTRKTPYQPSAQAIVVRDETNLDKFVAFLDLDAKQRSEKRPIVIPTGIIIHTLTFPDSNRVSVSGYVWQKFNKNMKVIRGIRFPEAAEAKFEEILQKPNAQQEIKGWNFTASFMQKHRYSWFPFDKVHIDIAIASADFENNVILAPDFNDYRSLDIDPYPGVINKIVIPGFNLERSYFSFATIPANDEVGLEGLRQVTEKVQLHYNIILERTLTNPFIIFLLPLLIILFSMFAVFLVTFRGNTKKDVFKSLSAYTALFFSMVILHQTLRSQYQAGELLYIEYFFFFTYITLLLLILHALIIKVSHLTAFVNTHISPYLRLFFWPVQFAVWFIVTMIIFYVYR